MIIAIGCFVYLLGFALTARVGAAWVVGTDVSKWEPVDIGVCLLWPLFWAIVFVGIILSLIGWPLRKFISLVIWRVKKSERDEETK